VSTNTEIGWTDHTWPVIRGCSKVSDGCKFCWAIRDAHLHAGNKNPKMQQHFGGLTVIENGRPNWTGVVRLDESILDWPLHWKTPARIFAASSGDLFHEVLSDEAIDKVFIVMSQARQHTFQVLTKRPARMFTYFQRRQEAHDAVLKAGFGCAPLILPNVWLGVSIEDQATADARIPELLRTPAALRFVSYEPALGPVDWLNIRDGDAVLNALTGWRRYPDGEISIPHELKGLDWGIVGGESGPGARPCYVEWIESTVDQFRAARVPLFVKQTGRFPNGSGFPDFDYRKRDRKGANMDEWPERIRVREFPR
jgi:protein gp37